LFPERYPDKVLVKLTPEIMQGLSGTTGCVLGGSAATDPFHVRSTNSGNEVVEVDRSDELVAGIQQEGIETVISVVGPRALSILWKLSRKGLKTVCVPKSVENDMAVTMLSFGFNTALSFTADMLERARQAAQSSHRIFVVEVLGEHAGWLALQSGMAVCADAVLLPEIPYDIKTVAARLREELRAGRNFGLVVVAQGAKPAASAPLPALAQDPKMKSALSPGATEEASRFVIERSGRVADRVALELQRLTDHPTYPMVLGALARGGTPTVVDRQLGLGYGAAAVSAVAKGQSGVMVVYQPPDLKLVALQEVLNKVRVIPAESEFVRIAQAMDISLGVAP